MYGASVVWVDPTSRSFFLLRHRRFCIQNLSRRLAYGNFVCDVCKDVVRVPAVPVSALAQVFLRKHVRLLRAVHQDLDRHLAVRIRFHICLKHTAFLVADICLLADRRRRSSLLSLPPQRFMKSGRFPLLSLPPQRSVTEVSPGSTEPFAVSCESRLDYDFGCRREDLAASCSFQGHKVWSCPVTSGQNDEHFARANYELATWRPVFARCSGTWLPLPRCFREFLDHPAVAGGSFPSLPHEKEISRPGRAGRGWKTEFLSSVLGAPRTLELICASCGWSPHFRQMIPLLHKLVSFDDAFLAMMMIMAEPSAARVHHCNHGRVPSDLLRAGVGFLQGVLTPSCGRVGSSHWCMMLAFPPVCGGASQNRMMRLESVAKDSLCV